MSVLDPISLHNRVPESSNKYIKSCRSRFAAATASESRPIGEKTVNVQNFLPLKLQRQLFSAHPIRFLSGALADYRLLFTDD
jgi:hypothetical protein